MDRLRAAGHDDAGRSGRDLPAVYSTACGTEPHLLRAAMTEAMPLKVWDQKLAEVPMQRAGEPEEIASVASFYPSDLSSYMTGTVAEVTGGRYM